jgi:hypothetical protein
MARNNTRLELAKLDVLERRDHAFSGARLVLACEKANASSYIVAWIAPWQKTISEFEKFDTADAAEAAFRAASLQNPPVTPSLTRDFQVSKVYAWEEKYIDKASVSIKPEQMERVIARIAKDFNMAAPKFKFREPRAGGATSSYAKDDHAIEMQHKKLSTVIHELAHAIDMGVNGNVWAHHGPSFVRTLIMLADQYQFWHSPQELEDAAKKMGIAVAPESAVPKLPPPKP